jgi:AraC-like DNA-binding protein
LIREFTNVFGRDAVHGYIGATLFFDRGHETAAHPSDFKGIEDFDGAGRGNFLGLRRGGLRGGGELEQEAGSEGQAEGANRGEWERFHGFGSKPQPRLSEGVRVGGRAGLRRVIKPISDLIRNGETGRMLVFFGIEERMGAFPTPKTVRFIDTTSPIQAIRLETIFSRASVPVSAFLGQSLHVEILGIYRSEVGTNWTSSGKLEGDCFHHINLVEAGRAYVQHEGRSLPLEPGGVYFFPGMTPISRECPEHYGAVWIRFRCEWGGGFDPLLHWRERRPIRLGPWTPEELNGMIGGSLEDYRMLMRWEGRITQWLADGLPDIGGILNEQSRTVEKFSAVLELIDDKLGADLRVEDLAAVYGSGVQTFSRHFAEFLQQNPKTYLKHRLNQKAIHRVLSSGASIKEIAAELKFSDEFYFSRFFTRENGVSPSHYRRLVAPR